MEIHYIVFYTTSDLNYQKKESKHLKMVQWKLPSLENPKKREWRKVMEPEIPGLQQVHQHTYNGNLWSKGEKRAWKIFEKVMAESCLNLMKNNSLNTRSSMN